MNYLNKTSGAMSLSADVAGIANSIGQGGSLAGFLKDLGHTSSSSPGALRQAIRVGGRVQLDAIPASYVTVSSTPFRHPLLKDSIHACVPYLLSGEVYGSSNDRWIHDSLKEAYCDEFKDCS